MKRLLILTAAAAMMASSSGCWHWFNRGGSCQPPASSCGGAPQATYAADPYMAPPAAGMPMAAPGATYVTPGPQ